MAQDTRRLARDLRAHVEWARLGGVTEVALTPASADAPPARARATRAPAPSAAMAAAPAPERAGGASGSPPASRSADVSPGMASAAAPAGWSSRAAELARAATLDDLRGAIGDCRLCRLCERRTQIVFGVGNPRARLVFVGEGPGHDEDVKGEPFVGRAGQLLTDIIEKGMRLKRSDVYICNVVKCRPPDNRNPEPDEVAACAPFLARQIEIVQPEVLVTLGKFAAHALLETKTPITRLRGTWQEYRGIPVMPTFHPAYLLRNPGDKKLVWQDIKQVMARLGMPP